MKGNIYLIIVINKPYNYNLINNIDNMLFVIEKKLNREVSNLIIKKILVDDRDILVTFITL